MRRTRPLAFLTAAAAVAAAAPAPAGAVTVATDVTTSGQVTLSWRGDPELGCAERGVCDVRGAVTLASAGQSSGSSSGAPRSFREAIQLPGGRSVVRVLRGPLTDPAGACVESFDDAGLSLEPVRGNRRRVRLELRLGGLGPVTSAPAGRCAGPLPADLEGVLPAVVVPTRLLRSGRSVLDLGGVSSFRAGPFRVEVQSSLRARVTRRTSRDDDAGSDEGLDPGLRPPSRRRRTGPRPRPLALQLSYRVAAIEGTITTDFSGGPGCLDAGGCGLQGIHELLPSPAAPGRLEVLATGTTRSIRRPTVAAALDALAFGRLEVFGQEERDDTRTARGVAVVAAGEGPACRDEQDVALTALEATDGPSGLRLQLGGDSYGFSGIPADPLRTRCEGPTRADVSGERALVFADVPAAALAQRSLEVRLQPGPAGAGGPFTLARRGEVVVRLERGRARIARMTP